MVMVMSKWKVISATIAAVLVLWGAGYTLWNWREASRGLRAQPVDLSTFSNGLLEENWVDPKVPKNTLSSLPTGRQILGGVRFDVGSGVVQLNGGELHKRHFGPFPTNVTDILIRQKLKRLHLFHGAYFGAEEGAPVGTLTLHYSDGNTHTFAFNYGYHVTDWWFHSGQKQAPPPAKAAESELAWTGRNEAMGSHDLLRLFRTTFDNPRPHVAVASLDYGSTMTPCAPFLIAVSVE